MTPEPVIKQGCLGRYIIVHPTDPTLAWTGSRWSAHQDGIPTGLAQISNFESYEEAAQCATTCSASPDFLPGKNIGPAL